MIKIDTVRVGETALITVSGRIDSMNAGKLRMVLDQELNHQTHDIVLNLAEVNHMSAAGLRILRHIKDTTGHVRIASPSHRVREILQITGLDAVYEVYETQIEAVHTVSAVTNAFTNLELDWMSGMCPPAVGTDYLTWLKTLIERRWDSQGNQWETTFEQASEAGINRLIAAGVTMVADVTSTGLSIEPLLKSGLRGIVYVELVGMNPDKLNARMERVRSIIEKWRPRMSSHLTLGLAIHAPFTVHPDLLKRGVEYAKTQNLPLCIQVGRIAEEAEWMEQGTGRIKDMFPYPVPSPGKSSVAFLEEIGALELKPLLIRAIHVNDEDIQRIKSAGSTVVHTPRSDLRLHCGRMPLEKFIEADIPVLLGTGSMASAPSLSIFDDMEIAIALHHGRVPAETIAAMIHGKLPDID